MKYKIEVITTEKQFLDKRREWVKFENCIDDLSLTQSYDYLNLFWQNYKDSNDIKDLGIAKQLMVIFLYKQEELIAIFPLCRITRKRKKIFKVRTLEFIGQQFFANYSDIITPGITVEEYDIVKKWLFKNIKFDLIQLSHIPDYSRNKYSIYKNKLFPFSHSSQVLISNDQTYNQYINNVYSSNFKQNIRTLHNRIKKAEIDVSIKYKSFETNDLEELTKLSDFKIEHGKLNNYRSSINKTFLTQVYQKFNADICYICFNETKVAYLINLHHKEQSFWYDISFNREYKQFWPGTLLFDINLKESIQRNQLNIHLGWGVDFIKYRFCNKFVEISNFVYRGNTIFSIIWYYIKKKQCQKRTLIFRETVKKTIKI